MGDRAEVSHQTRTSDDHALGLGYRMGDGHTRLQTTSIGLGLVRLLRWAPHLRCGAACFCRWPTSGGGWEGRRAGRRRYGEPGGWCEGAHSWSRPTARAGALRASGDMSLRVGTCRRGWGHFCVGGDARRRRGRDSCPRTRGLSPAGAGRTWPRRMSPPAFGMRSPQVAAEARDPCQSRRPPARNCQQSGLMTWDASGPHPRKSLMGDKPDLSLVHLTGVQGSGFFYGNCSSSLGGRRIPDRSG